MVFSSILFIFLFLPTVLIIYYIAQPRLRNVILLISSLIFYACGEGIRVFIMIGSILVNYGIGLWIENKNNKNQSAQIPLTIDIVFNLGLLFVFKYMVYSMNIISAVAGFKARIAEMSLPIGISFFTFQSMSYVIDIYRGDVKASRNPLDVGLYISFFPQLIAGPIVRYNTISEQIRSERVPDVEKIGLGCVRFINGFLKKVILANNLAIVADTSFKCVNLDTLPVSTAWLSSIAFSLQIFFDFSGYSDMAIGLAKMFGFDLEENFNYPYISKSITEFWRRWHISLSRWFRDYVYIPLGGSRAGKGRQVINLLIVWTLTGIWHGANVTFVLWGLIFFVCLVIEKFIVKFEKRGSSSACVK